MQQRELEKHQDKFIQGCIVKLGEEYSKNIVKLSNAWTDSITKILLQNQREIKNTIRDLIFNPNYVYQERV